MNGESIFAAALNCRTSADRQAYLDEACGGDPKLRQHVEDLLRASVEAGSFLEHPPAGFAPTVEVSADGTHRLSRPAAELLVPTLEPCDTPGRIGKLGVYEIIEVVGHGGMATVMRAFDTKLSRVVAVKIMATELAANPQAVKRFLREAASAAAVVHDHVVTIHAIDDTHRPPYLVMEFVEGQTLQQKIDRTGALGLEHILRIGAQTAEGLAAAHKKGLIHRDVKPANILLENGVERVKITDFGLARAGDDLEMTKEGVIAGTPQYMSPEQAKGESIDTRSDLFSLGSVLYTMCTGRPAFRADSTMGVLRRVCEDTPRSIHEITPELPPWLAAIVSKLLAKDPEDRFQTATEVAELLGQHLAHVQSPSTVPQPLPVAVPLPKKEVSLEPAARPRFLTARTALTATALLVLLLVAWRIGPALCLSLTNQAHLSLALGDPDAKVELIGEDGVAVTPKTGSVYLTPGLYRVRVAVGDGQQVDAMRYESRGGISGRFQPIALTSTGKLNVGRGDRLRIDASLSNKKSEWLGAQDALFGAWRPLFNGRDLSGWEPAPASGHEWRVQNGILVGTGKGSNLFVAGQNFEEFHLRAEFKINDTGDGGIRFFVCPPHIPVPKGASRAGLELELQLRKDHEPRTGCIAVHAPEGILIKQTEMLHKPDEWTTVELVSHGGVVQSRVNGRLIGTASLPSDRPKLGWLGLLSFENHPAPNDTRIEFRKIEIREAANSAVAVKDSDYRPWRPLFNGEDLSGWKTHEKQPNGWKVEDGLLIGTGAAGHLFSESGEYGDFHFRAEAMINERGDSGIFFRSEYGLNGMNANAKIPQPFAYEANLLHDFPNVANTGSLISPRVGKSEHLANTVVMKPNTWCTLEIVAQGNRLRTLVDGKPRAELTDVDFRFQRGHFALQVYRPDTVVKFRKIEVREPVLLLTQPPALLSAQTLAGAKIFSGYCASWSADNKYFAVHRQTPSSRIEVIEPATGKVRTLVEKGFDPVWSPVAGGPIAFVTSTTASSLADDEVWLIESDGSHARRVAQGGYPSWSADGQKLYFRHSKNGRLGLYSIALSDPEREPHQYEIEAGPYPAVSLGELVADNAMRKPLKICDLKTGETILQDNRTESWDGTVGSWHPNGRYLGLGSYTRSDQPGAWLLDVDTNTTRLLAAGPYTCPRWSPDGTKLVLDDRQRERVLLLDASPLKLDPPLIKPELPTAAEPAVVPFNAEQAQAYQKLWAEKLSVPVEHTNSIGMKLRLIPPGEFRMGTTAVQHEQLLADARQRKAPSWVLDELALETPQKLKFIAEPYYIGQYEVTVADFRKFVERAKYTPEGYRQQEGGYGYYQGSYLRRASHQWDTPGEWKLAEDQPVVQISWNDAVAFCKWLSKEEGLTYELPTEAKWEFAARAGTMRLFGSSETDEHLEKYAWTMQTSPAATRYQPRPVGQKLPNAFGLFDTCGNAWELCQEWHKPGGTRRVTRGGGWNFQNYRAYPATRGGAEPNIVWDSGTGFRVVITGDLSKLRKK